MALVVVLELVVVLVPGGTVVVVEGVVGGGCGTGVVVVIVAEAVDEVRSTRSPPVEQANATSARTRRGRNHLPRLRAAMVMNAGIGPLSESCTRPTLLTA